MFVGFFRRFRVTVETPIPPCVPKPQPNDKTRTLPISADVRGDYDGLDGKAWACIGKENELLAVARYDDYPHVHARTPAVRLMADREGIPYGAAARKVNGDAFAARRKKVSERFRKLGRLVSGRCEKGYFVYEER